MVTPSHSPREGDSQSSDSCGKADSRLRNKLVRAVLYARVSSDDTSKECRNLKGQLEMAQEYAQQQGHVVVAEISEDERGARGQQLDLPGLNRVLEMARRGEFDVLVVRELDRLARRLAKQLIVEEQLRKLGVQIEYVIGRYPDTSEGRLHKNLEASIKEYEAEKITERAVRGRRNVVKSGRIMLHGKSAPYGYRLSGDRKNLDIYEPEARVVRLIFQWYVEGDEDGQPLASGTIARRLTEMGVPTWTDVHGGHKKRNRGEWEYRYIIDFLRSETYKGAWHYGRRNGKTGVINPRDNWLKLEVPAIVTPELWARAQEQILRNTTEGRGNVKEEYLLRRRARCGLCNSSIFCMRTLSRGRYYKYYRCNGHIGSVANVECPLPSFRTDHVDAAVWAWIKSFLSNPEALRLGLEKHCAEKEEENAPLKERLAVVQDLIARNRTQLERLLDIYISGEVPKEMLLERKTRLEKTLAELEQEQSSLVTLLESTSLTDEQIQNVTAFARRVARGLEAAEESFAVRRQIVETLNVWARLSIEQGEKVVYVTCVLGEDVLPVMPPTSQNGESSSDRPPHSGGTRRPADRTCRPGPLPPASG